MRLTIFLLALSCFGQEGFNGGITVWAGPSDHSAATHSLPFRVATSDPATCTVGEFVYRSDLAIGSRLRECTTTNNFTTVSTGGGGGSVTGRYSASLNFGSVPDLGCLDLTMTATGITAGAALSVSAPAAIEAGLVADAWVSAADTVKVRVCNASGAAVDPANGTYAVRDMDTLGYLNGSSAINFGDIPDGGCLASTFALTGATTDSTVSPGWPAAFESGLKGFMFVSAADTIAVRVCNFSGASVNPASGTFKAAITK